MSESKNEVFETDGVESKWNAVTEVPYDRRQKNKYMDGKRTTEA